MALNPKYKEAAAEGRLATFTVTNYKRLPLLIQPMATSQLVVAKGARRLTDEERYFEVHMVTRRSTVNPRESFTFHLVLGSPIRSLPQGTSFVLNIGTDLLSNPQLVAHCPLDIPTEEVTA